MKRWISVILMACFLSGCATTQTLKTPSGRAEVTIPNATKKQVMDELTNEMINKGYAVKSMSDYNVVYAMTDTSFKARMFFGTATSTPERRIAYNLIENSDGVRIVLNNYQIISNPGTGYESIMELEKADEGMAFLEKVKTNLMSKPISPKPSAT